MPVKEGTFTPETVVDLLRKEGLRITKGRLGIVKSLFQAKGPMTLQEIQASAAEHGGPQPDYATVFRMIALMEKLRLVHKVSLQRSCSYYELNDPRKHYDHLVCKGCGDVVLLDIPCPLHAAEKDIAERYGFRDLSHSLEFFGLCSDCSTSHSTATGA
jgi:Fur family transcriptional regulator, ferric uptake regulator